MSNFFVILVYFFPATVSYSFFDGQLNRNSRPAQRAHSVCVWWVWHLPVSSFLILLFVFSAPRHSRNVSQTLETAEI